MRKKLEVLHRRERRWCGVPDQKGEMILPWDKILEGIEEEIKFVHSMKAVTPAAARASIPVEKRTGARTWSRQ